MKAKNPILRLLFIVTIALTMVVSCTEDELKPGCTNPDALNYNPDAKIDDGSCGYASTKFIGSYSGISECTASSPIGSADFQFSIVENIENPNTVDIRFAKLLGIAWTATVNKDKLVIDQSIISGNPKFCMIEHTTKGTMNLKGTAALQEGGQLLSFSDFTYTVFSEAGDIVCRHSCIIDATRN